MFIIKICMTMVYANSYSLNDGVYQFNFDDGYVLYPMSSVMLVRDESDLISVKYVANNETILLVRG